MLGFTVAVLALAGSLAFPALGADVPTYPPQAPVESYIADSSTAPHLRILRVVEVTDGTTQYMMPIWSKDGTEIGFYSDDWSTMYARKADGSGPIDTVDRRAATARFRVVDRLVSDDVRLAPDFRKRRMWVIKGGVTTEFPYPADVVSISPLADRVAFYGPDGHACVARLDGSSLVDFGQGDSWDWSPDGMRLAYVGAIEQDEWNVIAADIYIGEADGSNVTRLTHTPDVVEEYPAWSPDGMRIAYSGWNTRKIYVAILEWAK